ncbi:MAG TPA: YciI family protein [Usitatibacter sp.]|jgi:hypothetical protein|nr:YciI family protein [Usitatibacter sp.]
MAKFILILGGMDVDKRLGRPNQTPAILEKYMAWIEGVRRQTEILGSYKLHDQGGRRLTVRGGEVMDGPFIETKEAIGGVFLIEAASLDEATAIARGCPIFEQNGYVEIRSVELCNGQREPAPAQERLHERA